MGEISLRRRLEPTLRVDVWEAMLGDEHLMSSLFTTGEVELAHLALAEAAAPALDVVVGRARAGVHGAPRCSRTLGCGPCTSSRRWPT